MVGFTGDSVDRPSKTPRRPKGHLLLSVREHDRRHLLDDQQAQKYDAHEEDAGRRQQRECRLDGFCELPSRRRTDHRAQKLAQVEMGKIQEY